MAIEFKEITRGRSTMVFMRATITKPSNISNIKASAHTLNGNEIPVQLLNQGLPDDLVVALPQLDVPTVITLESSLEAKNVKVSPLEANIRGKLNTFTHNEEAERIRNADIKERHSSFTINVTDVIPDWTNNQYIVRGVASMLFSEHDTSKDNPVNLLVLTRDGKPLPGPDWICLADVQKNLTSGSVLREVCFSFRLPMIIPNVIIWVQGIKEPRGDFFLSLTSETIDDIRRRFVERVLPGMEDSAYDEWFRLHCATKEELDLQKGHRFEFEPSFSIIVPLYKTPIQFFNEMAESVLTQTYDNFELILVNASPDHAELSKAVEALAARDSRVTVIELETNLGITENTNRGIELAKGDFCCFLDHDDVIEPNLLYEYVKGINDYPHTDLLYCDEDKLQDGRLTWPYFKPDWDPELLCSLNFVTHLLTVRKGILDALDPATNAFDGSQDHNMTFRVGELARNVYHVRKPLYHWRVTPNSTSGKPESKPYTMKAGILSVQNHLDRLGVPGTVVRRGNYHNIYQIDFDLTNEPLVSIIIPNKDHVQVLDRCLASIERLTTYSNYEIIIAENNSVDSATFAYYDTAQKKNSRIRVVSCVTGGEFNYSYVNNYASSYAKGKYLLLLNNDVEVISPDWINQLVGPCLLPDVGVVGAKLLFPDNSIQHGGIAFPRPQLVVMGMLLPRDTPAQNLYYSVMRDSAAVTGACLLTPKWLWDQLGGLDESFKVNYNDVDYCLRAWKLGKRVVYQPAAELYHYESTSRGITKSKAQNRQWRYEEGLLMSRYPNLYAEGDPFQNPNVEGAYFHLRW